MSNTQQIDGGQKRELQLPPGADVCEEELTTTYDDNLGSYGNMFDIQTHDDEITLYGIDFYTDITTEVSYEIYTKPNSFRDDRGKLDISAWTVLKKGSALGAGWGMGTPVRDFESGDLKIAANQKQSFYVTLNSNDLRYRDIRVEMPTAVVGDLYKNNEDLEVHVGVSLAGYPLSPDVNFFGMRVWSGTLHYTADRTCQPSASPTDLESEVPSASPSVSPSKSPTLSPSGGLTKAPTISPSWSPTGVAETRRPTVVESASPTSEPSTSEPTLLPSSPSVEPSESPSNGPTDYVSPPPSPRDTSPPSPAPSGVDSMNPSSAPITPIPSEFPSKVPTLMPSTMPSTLDTEIPSIHMSLAPSLEEAIWECSDHSVVQTTFDGGTGAYGNMFTVTSKEKPVQISTLSFHTDYSEGEVTAMVYTRMGDFVGYENEPQAWRKICESSLRGGGAGFPSMIPKEDFESVSLLPGQTASFYITLTTADIRYTRTNRTLGTPVASHKYLDVNAGVGLADYPFASEFFLYAPRSFNGMVHFDVESDCLPLLSQTYSFNVYHPSDITGEELYRLIASRVEATARTLMETQDVLVDYANDHQLSVDSATAENAGGSCTPFSPTFLCTPIDATVLLKHAESLRPGELKYQWLNYYEEMTSLNVNLQFQAQYVGDIPVDYGVKIKLNANQIVEAMSPDNQKKFEVALIKFLNSNLDKMNVTVLDVKVTDQVVETVEGGVRRFLQRGDDDTVTSSVTSISVSTNIVGEYRPPPEIDFSGVVSDAIDADNKDMEQAIKREGTYFEIFDSIEATTVITDELNKYIESPTTPEGSFSLSLILIIALVCTVSAFVLFVGGTRYLKRKRRERARFAVNPIVGDSSLLDKRGKKSLFGNFGRSGNNKKGMLMEADVAWAEVTPVNTQYQMAADKLPQSLYDSRQRQPYRDSPEKASQQDDQFHDEGGGYRDNSNHDSYDERDQNVFHESYDRSGFPDSQGQPVDGGYHDQEVVQHDAGYRDQDGGGYDEQSGYGDVQAGYDDGQAGYDDGASQQYNTASSVMDA